MLRNERDQKAGNHKGRKRGKAKAASPRRRVGKMARGLDAGVIATLSRTFHTPVRKRGIDRSDRPQGYKEVAWLSP